MSGIYIHIPYCRQVCYYCDFHFRTDFRNRDAMLAAMQRELFLRKDYLRVGASNTAVEASTLYLGGGTPSVLSLHELDKLLNAVHRHYCLSPNAEITIEANPDDLSNDYLVGLRQLGFNRLSIGIQSFYDTDLRMMNRRHDAQSAVVCVERAQKLGFDNINIDMMYGLPSMDIKRWRQNLIVVFLLKVPHLSAYHLTIEPRTVFGIWRARGKSFTVAEEDSVAQYNLLLDMADEAGYEHYEISNFAYPGARSRHNTAYWQQVPYIGIGPSAHSFDGRSRQWNIGNNTEYIKLLSNDEASVQWFEREELSVSDAFNDYLLTGLRTYMGVDINYIERRFGHARVDTFERQAAKYLVAGLMFEVQGHYILSRSGQLLCDRITADLLCV